MNILIGIAIAILGGAIQGAFVFPMKYMKKWEWENGWMIFTVTCCLVFPILLAVIFIPNLWEIYKSTDFGVINTVFWFGVGWGIGAILFGLGAKFLGMSIGIALITGINACLGTLFPIIFLQPGKFSINAGIMLGAGMLVLVLGIVVISLAGLMREKELNVNSSDTKIPSVPFIVGLLVCIAGGIFTPMMNFAIFFGQPISKAVHALGTVPSIHVGYAQLMLTFVGGSFAQAVYCIYLFKKNKSFKNYFLPGTKLNWLKGVSMAVLFIIGMVLYTIASTNYIKDVGPIVGWPLFLSATIIASNILGVASKEWKGVGKKAFRKMYGGLALLIIAIVLASLSNLFIAP